VKDCVEISISVSFEKEEVQGYRSNDDDKEKLVVLY